MVNSIGNKIDSVRLSQGIAKSELARKLNKHRQTVEDIVTRESIDSSLLFEISKALNYNFFEWLSTEYKLPSNEPVAASSNEWQRRYNELMEENRQLNKELHISQKQYIESLKELKNVEFEVLELKGAKG